MAEHTQGPWVVGTNEASNYGCEIVSSAKVKAKRVVCRIGGPDREANAAFIVKACNSHSTLVEALEKLLFWNKGILAGRGNHHPRDHINIIETALESAKL